MTDTYNPLARPEAVVQAQRDAWDGTERRVKDRREWVRPPTIEAPFILCKECDGRGWYEDDGTQCSCPVCDGEPKITFATVKSYAEQIDRLLCKMSGSQADQVRMFNSLTTIREHSDPDCTDGDNYRMDDPEGALDTIFTLATEALKAVIR
jgi:hypothetical protein